MKRLEKKKQKKKERLEEFQEGEGEDDEERWEKVKKGVPLVKVKHHLCIYYCRDAETIQQRADDVRNGD